MKKLVVILGIILTSGIATFALSGSKTEVTDNTQVKADRIILEKSQAQNGASLHSDIATAD
ncbi:hypothetical protein C8P68_10863 [Mucilaginibacter yixingensis]|uniref:Uncharacterized protein n=1 Tax=Mucilaginibacter yixingensis TaxID=1295612 RepID=A0A2T5J5Q6_9SPHI|nr:hypothetical protein [Mucilaginibacter yixingensis]PTQ93601.1 hypothetical protein C8P68_10863 [Mucilaginibacter yixingensis]